MGEIDETNPMEKNKSSCRFKAHSFGKNPSTQNLTKKHEETLNYRVDTSRFKWFKHVSFCKKCPRLEMILVLVGLNHG